MSIAFGKYLETHDIDAVPLFAFCAIVASFVFALFLPRDPRKTKASNDNISASSPLVDLMTNGNFIIFISVSTLLHMSHGFFYTIGSVQWQDIGFDKGTIGYLWAVGVMAEIIFFLFGSKFMEKIRPMYMFVAIAFLGVVRWVVMAEVTNLSVLYAAQLLHGFTFGATHLASMYFISSRVPLQYSATAQGLYSALPMGIGTGITMFASGFLYNIYGAGAYYVMAICCFLAFFLSFKLRRLTK
jgi:PPP family 3-phenylpropionic acid transporter